MKKIIAAFKKMKREQWIVCALAGLLLLVIAMPTTTKKPTSKKQETVTQQEVLQTDICQEYELQLTKVLSQVKGVGRVQVAVTLESDKKRIVEKDRPQDTQISSQTEENGAKVTSQSSSQQETTIYEETDEGSLPYVSSELYPEIRGVVVVAEGGDDPVLVQQIQEAVMALYHIEAHKVKILKMK